MTTSSASTATGIWCHSNTISKVLQILYVIIGHGNRGEPKPPSLPLVSLLGQSCRCWRTSSRHHRMENALRGRQPGDLGSSVQRRQ
jgi:hypothetical protein